MTSYPAVFVSHGGPDMPLRPSPVVDFLKQLGTQFAKPKAILMVSAHWGTGAPTVSTAATMDTIHDFWGFPPALYQLKYPAPGAPELAVRVMDLLTEAGFAPQIDRDRGLDHGAWEPLMLMYPEADIPVTQLSIQPHLGTAHHLQLGRALAALKDEGVLIVASGTATHNLRALSADHDAPVLDWVVEFDQWLAEAIAHANLNALLDYRRQAPHARQSHPSEEHFLPLFVALGAGGNRATQLHSSFQHGALSMAAYAFAS